MAKGHALLVGLRRVDPQAYGGWSGENGCYGCELDVDNVARILTPLNYTIQTLKTEQATTGEIIASLGKLECLIVTL
jgi:hypothetical protein